MSPRHGGYFVVGCGESVQNVRQNDRLFSKNLKVVNDPPASQPDGQQLETQHEGGSTGNHPGKVIRIGMSADEVKEDFFYKA